MTAVCLGGGPSLTAADVRRCRGLFTIAINNAVSLAPWADVLLGGELKWWHWHAGCPGFRGEKITLHRKVPAVYPDVMVLEATGLDGMEWTPGKARSGGNSGYVAIQLAAQRGAKTIVLLGYDMAPSPDGRHHQREHPDGTHPNYALCAPRFRTLVDPLRARGVQVYNCSRSTALEAFPCLSLDRVLTT